MRNQKILVFLFVLGGFIQQIFGFDSNHETIAEDDETSRLISQTTVVSTAGENNIEFGSGIYDRNSNRLWVFAAENGADKGAVGNFFAKRVVGQDSVIFTPTAPQTVTLNGVTNQVNPLYNVAIQQATLGGSQNLPVVLYGDGSHVAALGNATGTTVFKNGTALYDANIPDDRAELESAGVALAADHSSNPLIVIAIPQGGDAFSWGTGVNDGTYRGFALVQNNGTNLVQMDPDNVTAPLSQSFFLNLASVSDATPQNVTVAFYKDSAVSVINTAAMDRDQGGNSATICRDETLNRYFVGLQNVSRGEKTGSDVALDNNRDGGVVSLLVAGIDTTTHAFFLKPILANPVKTAFAATADRAIIGFYREANQADDYRANIYHACVMHTSTGRDYIIVNGGVVAYDEDANPTRTEVYALPVMPATSAHAGKLATTHGTAAFTLLNAATENLVTVDRTHVSPDFYTGSETLFSEDERRAVVGADPRFLDKNQTGLTIQDMYIVGDSVIVAVGGDRSECLQESGIFQSTALFDNNGLIVGFTPWQRVGQITPDAAYAIGFDAKTGNYMYLTTNRVNI